LLGTGLILQQLSFGIPAALILGYRFGGQSAVDKILSPHGRKGRFRLPRAVGFVANALTIVHGLVALVFYTLPVQLPVTASNMSESTSLAPWWLEVN
jgi:choline transport protein